MYNFYFSRKRERESKKTGSRPNRIKVGKKDKKIRRKKVEDKNSGNCGRLDQVIGTKNGKRVQTKEHRITYTNVQLTLRSSCHFRYFITRDVNFQFQIKR